MRHLLRSAFLLAMPLSACGGGGGGSGGGGGGGPTNALPVVVASISPTTVSRGGSFGITFTLIDADSVATAKAYADADGLLATSGDRTLLDSALSETGPTSATHYPSSSALATGSYGIVLVATDGTNAPVAVLASGSLTVIDVDGVETFGTASSNEEIYDVVGHAASGAYFVGGVIQSTTVLGAGEAHETTLAADGYAGFFAKYASDDTLLWARLFDGPGNLWASASVNAALFDGGAVIAGGVNGPITFGAGEANETTIPGSPSYLARLGADGTLAWIRTFGPGYLMPAFLAPYPDGSVAFVGSFFGTVTLGTGEANETTLVASGDMDTCVVRINANGTLAWAKRAGSAELGFEGEWATGIARRSDGSLVVVGSFKGSTIFGPGEPNETTLVGGSQSDAFVACFGGDGALQWVRRSSGFATSESAATSVVVLPDDTAVVGGNFDMEITLGIGEPNETTVSNYGISNFFLARFAASGDLLWAKRGGRSVSPDPSEHVQSLNCLPSGDVIVVGNTNGGALFLGEGEPNATTLEPHGPDAPRDWDIFVARYTPTGMLVWARRIGGVGDDLANGGSFVASDESIRFGGWFHGVCYLTDPALPNPVTATSNGQFDALFVRLNANGNP